MGNASGPLDEAGEMSSNQELGLNQLVPELSSLASSLLRGSTATTNERGVQHSHGASTSRSPGFSISVNFGRNGTTANRTNTHHHHRSLRSAGTQTTEGVLEEAEGGEDQVDDPAEVPSRGSSSESEGERDGGEEANGAANDFPHLRNLLRNPEALMRGLWRSMFEFPNLHGIGVVLTLLVVLLTLTAKFLLHNFGACLAFVLALFHYGDAARFQRCLSGVGEIYFPIVNIVTRNFVILYVLNKEFVLQIATFQEQISSVENPTFFSTLYRVVVAEMFIMDVALLCKILVSAPFADHRA